MTGDPYRDWLRTRLGQELGLREAEAAIQGAVQRRGWPAMRPLGPRDVVAVLQDVYSELRQSTGDTRADSWLQTTTVALAEYAQAVPDPAPQTADPQTADPHTADPHTADPHTADSPSPALLSTPPPLRWGRRAYDLPLLLARAQAEMAGRQLAAIRADSELAGLSGTAEWDVQATGAEVRRWETEKMLSGLRAEHSRVEVADAVATSAAQAAVLRLSLRELQGELAAGRNVRAQLAHTRLSLTQLETFLQVFPPLIDPADADTPLAVPDMRLDTSYFSLEVPLDPAVLRARHALKLAQWQVEAGTGAGAGGLGPDQSDARAAAVGAVVQAQRQLEQAEAEARTRLDTILQTARTCQAKLVPLLRQLGALEERLKVLGQVGGDPLSLARVRLEWRQQRQAARVQAHLLEQSMRLLAALVDRNAGENENRTVAAYNA